MRSLFCRSRSVHLSRSQERTRELTRQCNWWKTFVPVRYHPPGFWKVFPATEFASSPIRSTPPPVSITMSAFSRVFLTRQTGDSHTLYNVNPRIVNLRTWTANILNANNVTINGSVLINLQVACELFLFKADGRPSWLFDNFPRVRPLGRLGEMMVKEPYLGLCRNLSHSFCPGKKIRDV